MASAPNIMTRAGLFVVTLGTTGCLLYSDPINMAPSVDINGTTEVSRGDTAKFSAVASDVGAGFTSYAWNRAPGACPATGLPSVTPTDQASSQTYAFTATDVGPTCVWVVVTDQHGATASRAQTVTIKDRVPCADLTLVAPTQDSIVAEGFEPDWTTTAPFPLYSNFRMSGQCTNGTNIDALTYAWTITAPDRTSAGMRCNGASDDVDVCFPALTPGTYDVQLVATDRVNTGVTRHQTITVGPDLPPCIAQTSPDFSLPRIVHFPGDGTAPLTVAVVNDDGDPLPPRATQPSNLKFEWWLSTDQTNWSRVVNWTMPVYPLPLTDFQSGQTISVRVGAIDRTANDGALNTCAQQTPMAPALCQPRANCNQWVTWKVFIY